MVSVVLLIAIAAMAAMSLLYWAAGQITAHPATPQPILIAAIPLHAHAGYLQATIANLGSRPIPEGGYFAIAENGAQARIIGPIPPETVSDMPPSAMQSVDGLYRLATTNTTAVRIITRTDPMTWATH